MCFSCLFSCLYASLPGTHAIQNISVSSPLSGQVRVTGDFVQGSTATGVLIIVYTLINDSDIHYISDNTNHSVDVRVSGLSGTEYNISTYTLEDDLPFSRAVGLPKNVSLNNSNNSQGMCGHISIA